MVLTGLKPFLKLKHIASIRCKKPNGGSVQGPWNFIAVVKIFLIELIINVEKSKRTNL